MDERLAAAKRITFGPDQPGFGEFGLARQVSAGIVQIGETGESSGAVLVLQQQAALLLVKALSQSRNLAFSQDQKDAFSWEKIQEQPELAKHFRDLTEAQRTALLRALDAGNSHALVGLAPEDRRALARGLKIFVDGVSGRLEAEAGHVGRVLLQRWVRVGAAVAIVVGVILLVLARVDSSFERPNIALRRPVTMSSKYAGAGTDPSLLVDGDRTNLGFHTQCISRQWVSIDLGSSQEFEKVVVFNRADCCQERAVPIRIEVSNDNRSFRKVAEQNKQFDQWTADTPNAEGRYVRLMNMSNNCFHLSEVEIY